MPGAPSPHPERARSGVVDQLDTPVRTLGRVVPVRVMSVAVVVIAAIAITVTDDASVGRRRNA